MDGSKNTFWDQKETALTAIKPNQNNPKLGSEGKWKDFINIYMYKNGAPVEEKVDTNGL